MNLTLLRRILKTRLRRGCFILVLLYGMVLGYLFLRGEGTLIARFSVYFWKEAIASGISIFAGFMTCRLVTYPLDKHLLKSTQTFREAVLSKFSRDESWLFFILFFAFLGQNVVSFFSR
ncbi:hypothetical protein [Mitsuokella multacida]